MTEKDVYAEIGEVVAGMKPGRTGKEMIVVDLTGTGAQDAAIGQVAWDLLSAPVPVDLLASAKYISDLTKQTSR